MIRCNLCYYCSEVISRHERIYCRSIAVGGFLHFEVTPLFKVSSKHVENDVLYGKAGKCFPRTSGWHCNYCALTTFTGTTPTLIIFQYQDVPECFIPLKPHQFDNSYKFYIYWRITHFFPEVKTKKMQFITKKKANFHSENFSVSENVNV